MKEKHSIKSELKSEDKSARKKELRKMVLYSEIMKPKYREESN